MEVRLLEAGLQHPGVGLQRRQLLCNLSLATSASFDAVVAGAAAAVARLRSVSCSPTPWHRPRCDGSSSSCPPQGSGGPVPRSRAPATPPNRATAATTSA
eukprot:1283272-Alexandrium_andersonii.AAC.1